MAGDLVFMSGVEGVEYGRGRGKEIGHRRYLCSEHGDGGWSRAVGGDDEGCTGPVAVEEMKV